MDIVTNIKYKYRAKADDTINKVVESSIEYATKKAVSKATHFLKSHLGFEIYFDEDDEQWDALNLLQRLDPKKFKTHSYCRGAFGSNLEKTYRLRCNTNYVIRLDPKKCNAFIHVSTSPIHYDDNSVGYQQSGNLYIFFFGKEAKKALKLFLNTLNPKPVQIISSGKKQYFAETFSITADKDGSVDYDGTGKIRAKSFEQIYTDPNNKKHITSYLTKWMNAVKLFSTYGISYKAGLLIYGPPGTGKSSISKTISAEYDLRLFVINMGDFRPTMIPVIQSLAERNKKPIIVLLEDIDYIFGKRTQDRTPEEKSNGNALLQLLDGVNGISNVIFIATTNDIGALDEAIKREGRFDVQVNMENINHDIAVEMIHGMHIGDENIVSELLENEEFPVNPAHLQNKVIHYVFEHLDTIPEAEPEESTHAFKTIIDRLSSSPSSGNW